MVAQVTNQEKCPACRGDGYREYEHEDSDGRVQLRQDECQRCYGLGWTAVPDRPVSRRTPSRRPWLVKHNAGMPENGDLAIRTDRGRLIALVYAGPTAPANAALISESPNLLAVCNEMLDELSKHAITETSAPIIARACEVINRATGDKS